MLTVGGERREIERGCVTSVKGSIIMMGAIITILVAMHLVIGVPRGRDIVHLSQSIVETDI